MECEMDELEKRLIKMDFKLQKAKEARDEYVNFLQQKYPSWKLPEMRAYSRLPMPRQYRGRILENLATSKYHWNLGEQRPVRRPVAEVGILEPSDPVPSGGPALGPDLIRIKRRLTEIASELEDLRERRLHLSTPEYYHSLESESWFGQSRKLSNEQITRKTSDATSSKSLYELRKQIMQINTKTLPETPRPDAKSQELIRAEYLTQKHNEVLATRNDNDRSERQELKHLPTDEEGNLTVLSKKQQNGEMTQQLLEAQTAAETNAMETSNLHEILSMLKQKKDQKKLPNKTATTNVLTTEKSKFEKPEQSANAPANTSATTEDGQSFLAKILGTSAPASSIGQMEPIAIQDDILETAVSNDDDSDSDFFA